MCLFSLSTYMQAFLYTSDIYVVLFLSKGNLIFKVSYSHGYARYQSNSTINKLKQCTQGVELHNSIYLFLPERS